MREEVESIRRHGGKLENGQHDKANFIQVSTLKQVFCSTWPARPWEAWNDGVVSLEWHPMAHVMLKDVLGSHQALGFPFVLVSGKQTQLGTA